MATKYDLSLIIRAVDKATEPLRQMNARIRSFTAPIRKLNNSFRALSEEAGIPRFAKAVGRVGTSLGRVGGEVWGLTKRLGLLAVGAGWALWEIVKRSAEAGDDLGMMAERVGLTVDAFAQLRFAANQADVEQEQFNSSMGYFVKALGQAKAGTGPLLQFLQKVAPGLAAQVKSSKSTEEALSLLTGAFEKIEDPAKIAALSAAAFGRQGLQMGVWLHQGTKAIGEQRAEFQKLAGSQETFAKSADDFAHKGLFRLQTAMGGLTNRIMGKLFPALEKLANALTQLLERHGDKLVAWAERVAQAISDWVDSGGLDRLAEGLGKVFTWIEENLGPMGAFKALAVILGVVLAGPVLMAVGGLVAALVGVGAAISVPLLAIAALVAAGGILIAKWDEVKLSFKALWDEIVAAFEDGWQRIKDITTSTGLLLRGMLPFGALDEKEWKFVQENGPFGSNPRSAGQARVQVSFDNMPRGARATVDPQSTADVGLDLGYSMMPYRGG